MGAITKIDGLEIKKQGRSQALKVGDSISAGDTLVTTDGKGNVTLTFDDKQVIALSEKTEFKVDSYTFDKAKKDNNTAVFSLIKGALRAVTGLIGQHNHNAVKFKTPTATIGLRGSDWMAALQKMNLYTGVNNGGIALNHSGTSLLVDAGQYSATLGANASQLVSFSQLPAGVFGSLPGLSIGGTAGLAGGNAATGASGATAGAGGAGVASASVGSLAAISAVAVGVGAAAALGASSDESSNTSTLTATGTQ